MKRLLFVIGVFIGLKLWELAKAIGFVLKWAFYIGLTLGLMVLVIMGFVELVRFSVEVSSVHAGYWVIFYAFLFGFFAHNFDEITDFLIYDIPDFVMKNWREANRIVDELEAKK